MYAIEGMIVGIVTVGSALLATPFVNRWVMARNPGQRSYRWGSFLGSQSIVVGIVTLSTTLFLAGGLFAGEIVLLVAASILYVTVGYHVLLKRWWAAITLTILSFNPLIWMAWGYFRNRRDEFISRRDATKSSVSSVRGIVTAIRHSRGTLHPVVLLFANLAGLVLAYGLLLMLVREMHGQRFNPIDDFDRVWFGWFIYLAMAAAANYFFLTVNGKISPDAHDDTERDTRWSSTQASVNALARPRATQSQSKPSKQYHETDISTQRSLRNQNVGTNRWCDSCKTETPTTKEGLCALCGTMRNL